jgi:hypothetical protein
MPAGSAAAATTTVAAEVNSARLTDSDMRDGVAALSTNVPLRAVGTAVGVLMTDGDGDGDPGGDEAGGGLATTDEALVAPDEP